MANHASRIIIKAVGDLDIDAVGRFSTNIDSDGALPEYQLGIQEKITMVSAADEVEDDVDIFTYKPSVSSDGVWSLSEIDLRECLGSRLVQ